MTAAGAAALLARIRLSPALGDSHLVVNIEDDVLRVRLCLDGRDRDTGNARRGVTTRHWPAGEVGLWDERRLLNRVRWLILRAAAHEVDEALLLDGRRVFDPHEARA